MEDSIVNLKLKIQTKTLKTFEITHFCDSLQPMTYFHGTFGSPKIYKKIVTLCKYKKN